MLTEPAVDAAGGGRGAASQAARNSGSGMTNQARTLRGTGVPSIWSARALGRTVAGDSR